MGADVALLSDVANRMSAAGQRFTQSRRHIVDVLATADRPLSIPEILEATPAVAQSSAYRNLASLEKVGVVTRVVTSDEWARYELSEAITGHHHHLVCSQCGAVTDVVVPDDVEKRLDGALVDVAGSVGFRLQHHRLDLIGVCKKCQ